MNVQSLIERKRDGGSLEAGEIRWLIDAYTRDQVPDYQMSAMLMAVFIRGLCEAELAAWMDAMLGSGERLDLAGLERPVVDKHSTGGVGDKISIPLGPAVAACGAAVPTISGRGLAHSGGTLDKLESIPGFNTRVDIEAIFEQLSDVGLVFAAQTSALVPADQKLYALRDATGTVPSVPLMATSIMSKKMAEDLDGLVLDVKVGCGAFMKEAKGARQLARTMVDMAGHYGVKAVALLTDMNVPLGREIGNACEVAESLRVLRGEGPDDVRQLVLALGSEMLVMAGLAPDLAEAESRLSAAIGSGAALDTLRRVVEAQGGDPRVIDKPELLPSARHRQDYVAERAGTVTRCDALQIGLAAMALGAGRITKEDQVDPAAGISLRVKPGQRVSKGEPLAQLAFNDENRLGEARVRMDRAWQIEDTSFTPSPLVIGEVRG